MALVTTPTISAVVAHIMQEKVGEYGLYQSVLFESEGLEGGKLWRALKPDEAQQLRKGQAVELTPTKTSKGKASWNIRPLDTQPAQPQPTTPPPSQSQQRNSAEAEKPTPQLQSAKPAVRNSVGEATPAPQAQTVAQPPRQEPTTEERRQQIEAYIFSMANLHVVCYQAAEQAYDGTNAPDEVIRAATSSLFISTERRFHLTSSQ